MEQSFALLSAQVRFLDTKLCLIHIPLHLYSSFVQPILQLLLPPESSSTGSIEEPSSVVESVRTRNPWTYEYPFVNVSVTPVECSIVCSSSQAQTLFTPVRDALDPTSRSQVSISGEEYVVIQVDGEGLEAGQRVLDLTSPLAMKGISIFFITTYFSDYVLVPLQSRKPVIAALEERGFAFSSDTETFVNVSSPVLRSHSSSTTSPPSAEAATSRHSSSSSARHRISSTEPDRYSNEYFTLHRGSSQTDPRTTGRPLTPPPNSILELQARTFALLSRRSIVPIVDPTLRLVQTAGRKDTLRGGTGAHASSAIALLRLQLGLVKSLIMVPRPRFLSVTLTDTEPASILLEKELLLNFGDKDSENDSSDSVLLGNREEALVPILLDLRKLPMESPGIICGVAGRLVGETATNTSAILDPVSPGGFDDVTGSIEMSYLSTVRAGTVMVSERELDRALAALKGTSKRSGREESQSVADVRDKVSSLDIKRNST